MGYRGGYLPKERRSIEEGLRQKKILGVVSTNALELGIDIGQLQVAIMCGYPGSIASTWQQAGRGKEVSVAILVASSSPPAHEVSLRCALPDNFVIIDETGGDSKVIGEVDRFSAQTLVHEDAIYLHQSQQYHITSLDYEKQKAYGKIVQVNYYTDASLAVDIRVLDTFEKDQERSTIKEWGEVMVFARATMFKKIKFHTHENIGYGEKSPPGRDAYNLVLVLSALH